MLTAIPCIMIAIFSVFDITGQDNIFVKSPPSEEKKEDMSVQQSKSN